MGLLGYIYLLEIEILRSKKEKMLFLPKFAVPKISRWKLKLFYRHFIKLIKSHIWINKNVYISIIIDSIKKIAKKIFWQKLWKL